MFKAFVFVAAFGAIQAQAALCPATCNGQNPVNPFDFTKKASQFGDPNGNGALGTSIQIPSSDGGAANSSVNTGQYFGQLDEFEKWTAKECGQSLNQDGDVLVSAPCNTNALDRWKMVIIGAHKPTPAVPIPGQGVIDGAYDQAKSPAAQEAQKKFLWRRNDGIALNHKNCFPDKLGFESPGSDLFAVYAKATFCSEITASKIQNSQIMVGAPLDAKTKLAGEAKAGVIVFTKDLNIIRVTADLTSPYQQNVTRSIKGFLFGQVVHNDTVSGKELKYDYNYVAGSIEKGASTTFAIGPIPITVEAGATGKVGINFMTRQTGFWANSGIVPYVDTTAFARGYVNAVIAQAGVEAKLVPLFRDALGLYGLSAVAVTQNNYGPSFIASSQVDLMNDIEALSGEVNIFAKIVRPKFIGWKWKKFTINLFKWSGIKAKGYLYDKAYIGVPVYELK